jgi:hypothetical protein
LFIPLNGALSIELSMLLFMFSALDSEFWAR